MRFDLLKVQDLLLALLLGLLVLAAGLARRHAAMERARPRPAPQVAPAPAPPPPPPRIVRAITKLAPAAVLTDEPASDPRASTPLRAGAVVEIVNPQLPAPRGRRMIQTQSGRRGWVAEESLADEASSAAAIALFDATDSTAGPELAARQGGRLHATPTLDAHIGGFARGEKLRKLRVEGKAWLVAASDGAGGRVVGYARATDVQWAPPRAVARPAVVPADPARPGGAEAGSGAANTVGAGTPSADGQPPAAPTPAAPADPAAELLEGAQDDYAAGNFRDAERKADEAVRRGSAAGHLLAAMAACKQGNTAKARSIAPQLTSAKRQRLLAACPALQPTPTPPAAPEPAPAAPAAPAGITDPAAPAAPTGDAP